MVDFPMLHAQDDPRRRSGDPTATTPDPEGVQWPARLIRLAREVRDGEPSGRARAELWRMVGMVLRQRTRALARPRPTWAPEDLEDVVSDKLLDLLRRFDSRGWEPETSHPGEVVNFLNAVARNALVDLVRRRSRRSAVGEEHIDRERIVHGLATASEPEPAEAAVERRRFVDGLLHCGGRLPERDRRIWRLRALLELSSREIAEHPDVRLRADHVDVILQRCRERLKQCMALAGFELSTLPPGTLLALWERTREGGERTEP